MQTAISRLVVSLCACAVLNAAATPVTIDPVIVSATRSEQSHLTVPASISIITRAEIEASGASNIAQVLRNRGGVQVSDLFGDASTLSVGMRGFGENANANTLVLVDGRRLNNTDIAEPNFDLIPLADIERIEIVQGSAGTLFGDQAVGGVINIITRRPQGKQLELKASRGSFDAHAISASVSVRGNAGFGMRITGDNRKSDNYRDHSNYRSHNVTTRLDFEHADTFAYVEVLDQRDHQLVSGALYANELAADRRQVAAPIIGSFIDGDSTVSRIGIRQGIGDNWLFEAEWTHRKEQVDFVLHGRAFTSPASTQDRRVAELTPRLIGTLALPAGEALLTLGYDRRSTDYLLQTPAFGSSQGNDQLIEAWYGQGVIPILDGLNLTLGARRSRVDNRITSVFFAPLVEFRADDTQTVREVGLSYRPAEQWRVFFRRDENFRFGKVDEHTNTATGVPLKTQTGVSWEAGVEWSAVRGHAKLVGYRLDLDNEIVAVPEILFGGFPANVNLDSTRRTGLIAEGSWQVRDDLALSLAWSWTDGEFSSGPLAGNEVPFIARHNIRLSADYTVAKAHFYVEVLGLSDRVLSGDFNNELPELDGYAIANLKADTSIAGIQLAARVNNVFDTDYEDFGLRTSNPTFTAFVPAFYPAPGRNFQVTVGYQFD